MATTIAELVFIPAPGVGHIMSTIEIAKLLVSRAHHLSITVLVIKPLPNPTFGSGSAITTYVDSLSKSTMDRISFIQLHQDETPPVMDSKAPVASTQAFINSHCKYVRDVVADMINKPGSGRVAGFVVDMFCTAMIDVANEFNVPTYVFFTSNAGFLGFMFYIQTLCDDHKQDILELSNSSDAMISIPSFVKPVPTKVFPATIKSREGLEIFLWSARKLRQAKAIMVNTFMELETHAIKSLMEDSTIPPVYAVGPILNLEAAAGNLSENDVIRWLDSQPPSSVVFLCFGSMGSFEEVQVKEIAHALERSGYHFVWSLRRPPSDQTNRAPTDYEDPATILPEGFLERTAGIGKVTGWVPQVALLAHHAVRGFVSHCGWNSLLESLWFGVPSATWPIYAEQQINAFEMVVELGLAVEIKLDYKKDMFNHEADEVIVMAEEIERGIRRLMEDNDVRTKVKEMSEKSRVAVIKGGSSYASVDYIIQDFGTKLSSKEDEFKKQG
ncbi:anthocyanidin 3-O-glucosyltransferase 2 [Lactuca sativa]|uniref:anthocyanidin 3-O-glucosyltransferase 2 n=1 Tax=Lactuca sativa TaxID=4236 RepID=UPI000CD8BFC5|nr:anthocyanidin 3-O-glucosyltransferase 2 [Lactuca sativa]